MIVVVLMTVVVCMIAVLYDCNFDDCCFVDGTTKSALASNLAESIAGAITIRAFDEEDRFFSKYLELIDANASPHFNNFSANEWLIQRLEALCAIVLSSSALAITLLPFKASDSGE